MDTPIEEVAASSKRNAKEPSFGRAFLTASRHTNEEPGKTCFLIKSLPFDIRGVPLVGHRDDLWAADPPPFRQAWIAEK